MAINFFESELERVQIRFNQAFGNMTVCDIRLRYAAILSICALGVIGQRINSTRNKDKARPDIRTFMRAAGIINKFFDMIEVQQKERSDYEVNGSAKGNYSNGRGTAERRCRNLSGLR